ncbi:hypothetical protein DFJ73DRAFT_805358, partial [Zopfochytrium polystomum]
MTDREYQDMPAFNATKASWPAFHRRFCAYLDAKGMLYVVDRDNDVYAGTDEAERAQWDADALTRRKHDAIVRTWLLGKISEAAWDRIAASDACGHRDRRCVTAFDMIRRLTEVYAPGSVPSKPKPSPPFDRARLSAHETSLHGFAGILLRVLSRRFGANAARAVLRESVRRVAIRTTVARSDRTRYLVEIHRCCMHGVFDKSGKEGRYSLLAIVNAPAPEVIDSPLVIFNLQEYVKHCHMVDRFEPLRSDNYSHLARFRRFFYFLPVAGGKLTLGEGSEDFQSYTVPILRPMCFQSPTEAIVVDIDVSYYSTLGRESPVFDTLVFRLVNTPNVESTEEESCTKYRTRIIARSLPVQRLLEIPLTGCLRLLNCLL